MVARAGQHRGKVEVMVVNFTPWLVTLAFRLGIAFSEPGNWSSVRTKTMLGLACPCASMPTNVAPLASSAPKATEANNSTVRLIRGDRLSVEGRRKKGVRPRPVT